MMKEVKNNFFSKRFVAFALLCFFNSVFAAEFQQDIGMQQAFNNILQPGKSPAEMQVEMEKLSKQMNGGQLSIRDQRKLAASQQPGSPRNLSDAARAMQVQSTRTQAANQSQQQAVKQARPDLGDVKMQEEAFAEVIRGAMPLTPEQIVTLRRLYNESQQAAVTSPATPPKPVATTQEIDLAPGATPPVVRLAEGFVTSVVFIDSTGQPWPVVAYDLGNPGVFNIQWDKKSNILLIQARSLFTYGNLAVLLKGLNTPVMITLVPGQKVVEYRADLRIPTPGPQALIGEPARQLPTGSNPVLMDVLSGIKPEGSQILEVTGCECQAWQFNNTIFLRTRLPVLAPAWMSYMQSPDGTKAYQLQKTSRVLASHNGKVVTLAIKGLRQDG